MVCLQVMGLVELEPLSEVVIGMAGTGLSIEARKRTSIAVELVANPGALKLLPQRCLVLCSLRQSIMLRSGMCVVSRLLQ